MPTTSDLDRRDLEPLGSGPPTADRSVAEPERGAIREEWRPGMSAASPLPSDRPWQDAETLAHAAARYVASVTRLALGFVFLWAFLDKLFGLGRSTPSARSWLNGGSPTTGYLSSLDGAYADTFQRLAGHAWVDWLFMAGLLGIGAALMLGVCLRIAAASGVVMLVFMWAASLPIDTNPFIDEHLIYAVVLVGLALTQAGDTLGLGRLWGRVPAVQRQPILR